MHVYKCIVCVCAVSIEATEGVRSPGIRVTDVSICHMGAGIKPRFSIRTACVFNC